MSKETEASVLESIKALDYKPNILARQLRNQKTNAINIIVPDITNPFFGNIIKGIEEIARSHDYEVYIIDVSNDANIEKNYISALAQKQVDGIISLSASIAVQTIEKISNGFPIVVACQYVEGTELPNVGVDNVTASKEMTEYVISLGHKNIGYITCSPNNTLYRDRMTGYIRALEENSIVPNMRNVFYAPNASLESGYLAAMELLQDRTITAICAAGDGLALGVYKAAAELGRRIPEDLSVTGFDDIDFASYTFPELTTVHQPKYDLGREAMRMLLDIMSGKELKHLRKILKHSLMLRGSTSSIR